MNKNIKSTILLSFLLLVGQSNAAQLGLVSNARTVLVTASIVATAAVPRLIQWHKQRQIKAQELLPTYAPVTVPILQETVLSSHVQMPGPLLELITGYAQKMENPTFAELHKETGGKIPLPVGGDTLTVKSTLKQEQLIQITPNSRWANIPEFLRDNEGIPVDQLRFFKRGKEIGCLEDLGNWKNSGPLTYIIVLHRANHG